MAIYLLKSVLCSALLLLGYQLLLKNKNTYQFNRMYLLLSLVFSLAIPFVNIDQTAQILTPVRMVPDQLLITVVGNTSANNEADIHPTVYQTAADTSSPKINYLPYMIAGLYSMVTLILLARFTRNIIAIRSSVQKNKKVSYAQAWLVLIDQKLTPHTFMNYIFINSDDYVNNRIEEDVLKHELAHALQWHSADVMFIGLLQVICWFNPFIFLYRKAIQLNHEFIADAAVIKDNSDVISYQYLLLERVSGLAAPGITCQFNYSVTKKRLIMMTKNTSAGMALLAKLAIIPVMAVAFILFCTKTEAQQPAPVVKQAANVKAEKPLVIVQSGKSKSIPPRVRFSDYPYTKDGVNADKLNEYKTITAKYEEGPAREILHPSKITAEDEQKMESIFRQMSMTQQDEQTINFFYTGDPTPPLKPTQAQLDRWKDPKYCGVWIDDKKAKNSDLENYKSSDFGHYFISRLTPQAINYKNYRYQVGLMTADYYKKYRANAIANRHRPRMALRMLNRHPNKI